MLIVKPDELKLKELAYEYFKTNLNIGDIIFDAKKQCQVYKFEANKRRSVYSYHMAQFYHDYDPSIKAFTPYKYYDHSHKGTTIEAEFCYSIIGVFTIPIGYSNTEISELTWRRVCKFDSGDKESYLQYCDVAVNGNGRTIVLDRSIVTPGKLCIPEMQPGVNKFTKKQLVAYVIDVNGEGNLNSLEIMKKVCELRGELYERLARTKVFQDADFTQITTSGPKSRACYGLKPAGKIAAQLVQNKLGDELGRV